VYRHPLFHELLTFVKTTLLCVIACLAIPVVAMVLELMISNFIAERPNSQYTPSYYAETAVTRILSNNFPKGMSFG
jgi:hypothetical protein